MTNKQTNKQTNMKDSGQFGDLRQRAEELVALNVHQLRRVSSLDLQQLIHELSVYQVELEMQNEELRRVQGELAASRDLYFELYDLAPVGYVTLSEKGLIVRANLTFADLLRQDREALIRRPLSEFVLPGDQDTYYKHFRQLRENGGRRSCDLRVAGPDGTPFHAHLDCSITRDAEGEGRVLVTVFDISDRVRADEVLQESEARYRGLYDRIPIGLYRTDPNGQILDANPALIEMLGFADLHSLRTVSAAELFVDASDRSRQAAALERDGSLQHFDLQLRRRDGKIIWVRDNSQVVYDTAGTAVYYEGSLEDITALRSLEEQQRQAQKMESVGQLAGGVAHDFNNLLTAIIGYASLAKGSITPDDPVQEDLDEILSSSERAAGSTGQLLAFSRKQIISPKIVDLNDLIRHAENMLRRLIREDIELVIACSPQLDRVRVDPSQIEQVLVNLVVNARDAMPEGGTLTVSTANAATGPDPFDGVAGSLSGEYVVLEVGDTGTGMPPEILAHIFEPFFTTKPKERGTGLGLATAHGIVKQHRGEIAARSQPGRGSTFTLWLPRVKEEAEIEAGSIDNEEMPTGTETILLVEDEPAVRKVAARTLSQLGYRLLEAVDGQDALRIVADHPGKVDLLVTDLIMPRMGGKALADALRLDKPGLKVLLMSGHTDDILVQDKVLDGSMAFLQKPFNRITLARKIRQILDQ